MAIKGANRYKILGMISPIVLCFAVGIVVCNLKLISINENISGWFRDLSILFALPMLLYGSDINSWTKNARKYLIAFVFCLIGGSLASMVAAFLYKDLIDEVWIPAGMMVGIYSGGTPNLFAVGYALGAEDEVFTLLNAAEVFWGAIYLLFLISIGKILFRKLLIHTSIDDHEDTEITIVMHYDNMKLKDSLLSIGLTIGLILFCVFVSYLIFDELKEILIVVLLTFLAVACSFYGKIRSWKGPFEIGDYFLLMFGVAVGLISDFNSLMADGKQYIGFVFVILIFTLLIQGLLSRMFHVEADTFIISSTAGLYGPVFIPLVSNNLKNKSVMVGGIALSLIGLAIGNFLGISLAYLVEFLLNK